MVITRREFLRRGSAAAALGRAGGAAAAAPTTPAIDTHTHFYDPTRPQGVPWPDKSDRLLYLPYLPEQFRSLAAPHGVVGTVVVEASPWAEDNEWVLDLARADSLIVGFVGHLEPGRPEFAARLRRFSANPLFRGLRFGQRVVAEGLGRRAFEEDLRRVSDRRLALDLLGGAAMLGDVVRLARLAPTMSLIVDHLPFGDGDQDAAAVRRSLSEIARLPNVYAKVSNVARRTEGRLITDPQFYRPGLDLLWELFGPDRAIFGSNWPVSERVAPYAVVHQIVANYFAAQGKDAAERFFWKNSRAAYRWLPRGAARGLA
jgi:L-fuconolactonase